MHTFLADNVCSLSEHHLPQTRLFRSGAILTMGHYSG